MKQYVINEDRLIQLLEEEDKLYLLECAGVDNWPGYDFAFEDREELDIEKTLKEEFKEDNKEKIIKIIEDWYYTLYEYDFEKRYLVVSSDDVLELYNLIKENKDGSIN